MDLSHGAFIPLIGGMTLANEMAFEKNPKWLASFDGFQENDKHIVNHYLKNGKDIPYKVINNLDEKLEYVDIVHSVCPCAGLSSLSQTSNVDSSVNDWMYMSTEYILNKVGPRVLWGENAPRLASKAGLPVVKKLNEIGKKYGYSMIVLKTQSVLHGLPQIRNRSFYFFFKGTTLPKFNFINKCEVSLEDLLSQIPEDATLQNIILNKFKPSEEPFYKFLLHKENTTHSEFIKTIEKTTDVLTYLENKYGIEIYLEIADWMQNNNEEKLSKRCIAMYEKLKSGLNVMRRPTILPGKIIGAFVGSYPRMLAHPTEDRYLNIRECMTIMKLPYDFSISNAVKDYNHICQNVPVTTAYDWANEIKESMLGNREEIDLEDDEYILFDNIKNKITVDKI